VKALVKTLVGDVRNVTVVAALVLGEVALVYGGRAEAAAFVIPPLTLAGVGWLARR
jgi:hypothetical protein